MSTVYWEVPFSKEASKPPVSGKGLYSQCSELMLNPKPLTEMRLTAILISGLFKTNDEAIREEFRKSLIYTFVIVEEKKQSIPYADFHSKVGSLDLDKKVSHKLFAQYAWYCGYEAKWNDSNVLTLTSRF